MLRIILNRERIKLNREKDLKDSIQKEIILNEKQTREHRQKTTIIFTENKFHYIICSRI